MIHNVVPIGAWIEPNSRLLDLGCGDGTLLRKLIDDYQVQGYGLEINPDAINLCIQKGLNVIEQDLNGGLENFPDNSFESVLMSQTLQALRYPHLVLDEMLRIGNRCISHGGNHVLTNRIEGNYGIHRGQKRATRCPHSKEGIGMKEGVVQ